MTMEIHRILGEAKRRHLNGKIFSKEKLTYDDKRSSYCKTLTDIL
jgi:hypothetical protein